MPPDTLHSPRLRALYEYWDRLRVGRPMPVRADIDPADCRSFLPYMLLLDVEHGAAVRFRFRLIGTAVVRIAGRDSTGRYLDEVAYGTMGDVIIAAYQQVVATRRPAASEQYAPWYGKEHQHYERLIMPLGRDRVDMVLAGMDRLDLPDPP